jgi:hypothetical protein
VNQTCVAPPSNCALVNSSNNLCLKCSTGYIVNLLGTCDLDLSCPNYMVRDPVSNLCVNGTIPHCRVYNLDGTCFECDTDYLKDVLGFSCSLVPVPVVCPNATATYRYVVINNTCVKVDINCLYYLPNGYCYWCILNFYAFHGLCYNES